MSLFRHWSPEEADHWTIHDLLACLLGVVVFFLTTIGIIDALLLQLRGFVALAGAVLAGWLMFRIIDPKLKALSSSFEAKQAGYLEELERRNRWEDRNGS